MWNPGDHLSHRNNPDLGPGRVVSVDGRSLTVQFPEAGKALNFSTDTDALVPLSLLPGSAARLEQTGEEVTVESIEDGHCVLTDGREVLTVHLWPMPQRDTPIDRLERGELDSFVDFSNRLDGLRLARLREADGLGSFLGGRIHLFPHQLYVAERACLTDPVRWLLADEVGLGKTVEACLIMNRLIHTGRAERTLVVVPETLTLQWLGELWRKHHQVFVLIDGRRLRDVAREYGRNFNPFDVHRKAIVSYETLVERPSLARKAGKAGIDLLVVDEAHHLKRPPRRQGNREYRAVQQIAKQGRNVLLLTATPLEDDAHGFFRLLQLLRPDDFPPEMSFKDRLKQRIPLPPCTSSTRRLDIGGLPPRIGAPVDIDDPGWRVMRKLENRMRARPAKKVAQRKRKADLVWRAVASPAALAEEIGRTDQNTSELIAEAIEADPRVGWMVSEARGWAKRGEKTLVFVNHKATLDLLRERIEKQAAVKVGVFHEELSSERRDIEVGQFRLDDGPAVLISTECGGEGRNFEFCHRLVLFDLPWHPAVVEQRIGRLDRIGRNIPTEIVYFRPPGGFARAVVALYEAMGIFEEPLGGLGRELGQVAQEVSAVAVADMNEPKRKVFTKVLHEARQARNRVRRAAYHELHRDPYRPEMAQEILDRVPPELDKLTEDVVLRAASRFGFGITEQSGNAYIIEFGREALVDHIPGVKAGKKFTGTFNREEAVERETIDFFANGHPLVEGILAELEDGPRGRVALLQVAGDEDVFGLMAIYKRGPLVQAFAVNGQGEPRPDLARMLTSPDVKPERVDAKRWTHQAAWGKAIRRMAKHLPPKETPQAVAAFRVVDRKKTVKGEGRAPTKID
jgi:ATP-dependent helicase HepA